LRIEKKRARRAPPSFSILHSHFSIPRRKAHPHGGFTTETLRAQRRTEIFLKLVSVPLCALCVSVVNPNEARAQRRELAERAPASRRGKTERRHLAGRYAGFQPAAAWKAA
jgi:hypothetical protein